MSLQIRDYAGFAWQLFSGTRSNGERWTAEKRQGDIAPYLGQTTSLRVLDLANGRLRPQYTLLRAAGHQVYGIDLINHSQRGWVDLAYRIGRWLYTWRLGLPGRMAAARTLIRGDVSTLPFPDSAFDLVTSIAAFEHFLDVPTVIAELHRVVRPGGIIWICIHLFTSLSGGHNLSLAEVPLRSVPEGVDPWDHLRQRRLPISVPLNEWRKDRYLEEIANHFEILDHYCATQEGEHLLTPEIERELADYSQEELTCCSYVILARRITEQASSGNRRVTG
jgi:SAM-dependent methyltransferase